MKSSRGFTTRTERDFKRSLRTLASFISSTRGRKIGRGRSRLRPLKHERSALRESLAPESEIFRGLSSLCRVRHPAVNQNALYRSLPSPPLPSPRVLYDDSRRFEISRCSTASINNGDLRGEFSRSASIPYFSFSPPAL